MRQLDGTGLKRLHRQWRRQTAGRVALLLDRVQQPYNVGGILRLAAAYRVEHLWLVGDTAPPAAPGARKVALGAERYLEWTEASAEEAIAGVGGDGLGLVGIELAEGAEPIHAVRLPPAVCLAIGHEDQGLSRAVLDACDQVVYIPQVGRVGSLNVVAATAIALYECRRQEWTAGPETG
jgi:tRNA (guanosine-2'-O-)-methyltransferase